MPESLRQMIEKQIERLGLEDRHILEVASVAGMEFSAAAVAAGVEEEVVQVEARCEELVRRTQFLQSKGIEEWPDETVASRYGFIHALYQEVLYERIPAGRRQRLHQRIGERLEAAYAPPTSGRWRCASTRRMRRRPSDLGSWISAAGIWKARSVGCPPWAPPRRRRA